MRFLGRVVDYCRALGPMLGLRWYFARILARLPGRAMRLAVIKPPHLVHPVAVRMNPSSDEHVFDQLFVRHEYALVSDRLKDQKVILDLGANVGYASAYFASRYPDARILAVEPDPGNYQLCLKNLEPYGDRVTTLNGAVWSRCARLALSRGSSCDGREWSTQVVAAATESQADVDAWDMPTLLDFAHVKTVDLVKVDIEGSEAELFAANVSQWLPRVRNICIELHSKRCSEIFFNALAEFEYEVDECHEFTLCLNLRPRAQKADRLRSAFTGLPVHGW